MSSKTFDFAIVGSGLPGLILASALSRWTSNIALIEGQEQTGGCHKKIATPLGPLENGLRFFPKTEATEQSLLFLEDVLQLKLIKSTQETNPRTYENGQFKKFLGFGEQTVDFYEELSYFLSSEEFLLNTPTYDWAQRLLSQFKGQLFTRSIVTKFVAESESSQKIKSVTINGTKTIEAKQFIFCGTFKDLSVLLPNDYLSSKAKSKLNKSVYWTAICLDLCHKEKIAEGDAINVLNGTTQDEIGPCVGRFFNSAEKPECQYSQWITFVDEELSDDSEVAASALKKMKRQIKRAYPHALEGLLLERIFVHSNYSGEGIIKLTANQSLPGIENLWIACGTQNPQKNLISSISQAKLVLTSLGYDLADLKSASTMSQQLNSNDVVSDEILPETTPESSSLVLEEEINTESDLEMATEVTL